eukprot:c17585_g2_i2.p1 GENE.c17585_g2_i2~~c17585_g2_i2.p1  ORF type:complete len:684 (+),score=134.02 c17585_g2_i2:233-2053(+)
MGSLLILISLLCLPLIVDAVRRNQLISLFCLAVVVLGQLNLFAFSIRTPVHDLATIGTLQGAVLLVCVSSYVGSSVLDLYHVLVVACLIMVAVSYNLPASLHVTLVGMQVTTFALFHGFLSHGQDMPTFSVACAMAGVALFALTSSITLHSVRRSLFLDASYKPSSKPENQDKSEELLSSLEKAILRLKKISMAPGVDSDMRETLVQVISMLSDTDEDRRRQDDIRAMISHSNSDFDASTEQWLAVTLAPLSKFTQRDPVKIPRTTSFAPSATIVAPVPANTTTTNNNNQQQPSDHRTLMRGASRGALRKKIVPRSATLPNIVGITSESEDSSDDEEANGNMVVVPKEPPEDPAPVIPTPTSGQFNSNKELWEKLLVGQNVGDRQSKRYPERLLDPASKRRVFEILETVDEWNFPVFELDRLTHGHALYFTSLAVFAKRNFFELLNINIDTFRNFLLVIEANYHPNPYHNSIHAADVVQTNHYMLHQALDPEEYEFYIFCSLIAAIVHDYEHTGVNNDFLIRTSDPRALIYNDRSCQENHHLAAAFACLSLPSNNIFASFEKLQRAKARETIIDIVLATDMAQHNHILSQFRIKLNSGGAWCLAQF